jgi:hypothetical protein
MQMPRSGRAAILDGKISIFGGAVSKGMGLRGEVYSPHAYTWSWTKRAMESTNLLCPDHIFSVGGKLVMFGEQRRDIVEDGSAMVKNEKDTKEQLHIFEIRKEKKFRIKFLHMHKWPKLCRVPLKCPVREYEVFHELHRYIKHRVRKDYAINIWSKDNDVDLSQQLDASDNFKSRLAEYQRFITRWVCQGV